MNVLLYKARVAGGTITKGQLLKPGTSPAVVAATGSTTAFGGVAGSNASSAEMVDVALVGIAEVKLGGTVSEGAQLTADSNGAAVAASDGDTVWCVALQAGVSGDIIDALIAPSTIPAAA